MRLDPEHARKLQRAIQIGDGGGSDVKFDLAFMESAMSRLNLWEQGLLVKALMRAVRSRRRSPEQRALLAIFVHQEGDHA